MVVRGPVAARLVRGPRRPARGRRRRRRAARASPSAESRTPSSPRSTSSRRRPRSTAASTDAVGDAAAPSRSGRSRTAGTAWHGTRARSSSSATPCPASVVEAVVTGSGPKGALPARRRRRGARGRRPTASRRRARTPARAAAAAATGSTCARPRSASSRPRCCASSSSGSAGCTRSTAYRSRTRCTSSRCRATATAWAGARACASPSAPTVAPGFHGHRSHEVHAVDSCPLDHRRGRRRSAPPGRAWDGHRQPRGRRVVRWRPHGRRRAVEPRTAPAARGQRARAARPWLGARERGRSRVAGRADGFWQVHPGAADTLVVGRPRRAGAASRASTCSTSTRASGCSPARWPQTWASRAGSTRSRRSVRACADARRNLHDLPNVRIHAARRRALAASPARAGRGRPRRARPAAHRCRRRGDATPCSTGRRGRSPTSPATRPPSAATSGTPCAAGWRVGSVRGFDLFPMTHHVECVALLLPPAPTAR